MALREKGFYWVKDRYAGIVDAKQIMRWDGLKWRDTQGMRHGEHDVEVLGPRLEAPKDV